MKKVLVTGGSGFIGSNLIPFLLSHNFNVLSIDIDPPLDLNQEKYFRKINILDKGAILKVFADFNPDYVIHLAAKADLKGENIEYYSANTTGVKNIIDAINKSDTICKAIFASTMLVCQAGYLPKNNFDYSPPNLYGKSKVESEQIIWNSDIRCPWLIIRPTSIWGPWIVNTSYRPFFEMILKNKYLNIPQKKASTKTYGFVLNSVYQIEKLMLSDQTNEVFYIGDTPPYNVSIWANKIANQAGKNKPFVIPYAFLKVASYVGDVFKFIGFSFPLNSFRLKNMTTNNVIDLKNLYNTVGKPPYTESEAIDITLKWFRDYYPDIRRSE